MYYTHIYLITTPIGTVLSLNSIRVEKPLVLLASGLAGGWRVA